MLIRNTVNHHVIKCRFPKQQLTGLVLFRLHYNRSQQTLARNVVGKESGQPGTDRAMLSCFNWPILGAYGDRSPSEHVLELSLILS